jgi:hypothetical protein
MNEGTRSGKSTIRLLGVSAERPTNGLYLYLYSGARGCGLGLGHTSSSRKDSTDSKPRQRVGRGTKTAEAFLRKKKVKSNEMETMKAHTIDLRFITELFT